MRHKVVMLLGWMVVALALAACGGSQPLPNVDATEEAVLELAKASLSAPTPIAAQEIVAFTREVIAIEQKRDAMASAAARLAPAFRSDLARAYVDGHSSEIWFEGIRGLKRKLVSLESPGEAKAVKDGLIEVYDNEIRSVQRRTRTEIFYEEEYEIGYLVGFYPDVTMDNFGWWGKAVVNVTSDATDWVAAQQLRAEVYEEWYRMLQDNGIAMEFQLPRTREPANATEGEFRQAAFEQQERSNPRGVFGRYLQQLPGYWSGSGIARKLLRDQFDMIWPGYLILMTGTEMSFIDYLQRAQPTVEQLKQGMRGVATLRESVPSGDETITEIAIRERFSDPATAFMSASLPFLRNVSASGRAGVRRGLKTQFRRQQELDPTLSFIDFAKQRGFFD